MNALDLLYAPLALVTAPFWARKKREGWGERFGRIAALPAKGAKPRLLLHAVSVGEVSALRTLVPSLAAKGVDVVVSATTDTGLARARDLYAKVAHVVRYPLDFSGAVTRFLDAVNPDVVALVELELWPNFVAECRRRGIATCVINGRLSERSFKGYARIRSALRRTFASLELAAVQDEDYAKRFIHMGVEPARCIVSGSMKWDNASVERVEAGRELVPGAELLAREMGIDRARPLIVAGSTGPTDEGGEEALLHAACPAGAQLLCAPRKPERFEEAARAMPGCVRRSSRMPGPAGGTRFLLDSIGELRQAYALADVVVVGRSFGSLFGSDPLEPLGLGKATLIGPSYGDFATIVNALLRDKGIHVTSRDGLRSDLARTLSEPAWREELARNGRDSIRKHQGATAHHERLLLELLRRTHSSRASGSSTAGVRTTAGVGT